MKKDFTLPNKEIKEIVKTFSKNKHETIFQSLSWIKNNFEKMNYDKKVFRKRDAGEIVESKKPMGCTDFAIAFLSFMRALDIRASYVETISEENISNLTENPNEKIPLNGHVFVRVKLEDISIIVDPTTSQIYLGDDLPTSSMFPNSIILDEGKDFSELGLNTTEDIIKKAKRLIPKSSSF